MEDALALEEDELHLAYFEVLILVVMEDALAHSISDNSFRFAK